MKSLYLDGLHYIFNEGNQREELYDVLDYYRLERELDERLSKGPSQEEEQA